MKNELLNMYNKTKKYLVRYLKKIKFFLGHIKDNLQRKETKKKYLTIAGIAIFCNLLLINLYISYGYFYENISMPLIHAKVGNIYLKDYDYVLSVYLENTGQYGEGSGTYRLSSEIPNLGYNYSGYKCQNNSILNYDDNTKTTSINLTQKEICSVYFDIINKMDITLKIMLEENINSNTYTVADNIPAYGYKYSHYECHNNSELAYNSRLHTITFNTNNNDYCSIYFTKEDEDILLRLFIEEKDGKNDYIERKSIPKNKIYSLNKSKSECINTNNERINTQISYVDGYVLVGLNEISTCNVYLDIENE